MKKLSLLVLGLATTQLGATECGRVLRDPAFDLWCGEDLCTWKVVRGEIRRAPTWHSSDAGVELVGAEAAISQLAPVHDGDGTCIHFELVANVDDDVEAYLALDVHGDGSIDRKERLPASKWKPLSYNLSIKAPFNGIRFELSKAGGGTAVLGRIHAEISKDGCDGLPVIDGGPAPTGGRCVEDANCASGMCRPDPSSASVFGVAMRCVDCDPALGAAACGAGMVCGRGEASSPVRAVAIECVPERSDELADLCLSNSECDAGLFCFFFVCGTCWNGCSGGEECRAAYEGGPAVCAPGEHRRLSGEPCATNDDCASSLCNGAERRTCEDGRPCTNPGDCPAGSGLAPGACTTVGVTGGTCQ